jgi:hypothetical protein
MHDAGLTMSESSVKSPFQTKVLLTDQTDEDGGQTDEDSHQTGEDRHSH